MVDFFFFGIREFEKYEIIFSKLFEFSSHKATLKKKKDSSPCRSLSKSHQRSVVARNVSGGTSITDLKNLTVLPRSYELVARGLLVFFSFLFYHSTPRNLLN